MQYIVGIALAVAVIAFGRLAGFDRDRAFYPTVLIITASYYVLFAVMGASRQTLIIEMVFAGGFLLAAVFGFKSSFWFVAIGMIAHGLFDLVRYSFIDNPGVPRWWPGFCMAIDVVLGAVLALQV